MELDIRLDMVTPSNVVTYYHSTVLAQGDRANWEGKATTYFRGHYFTQDCKTVSEGSSSAKGWRDKWVRSDTGSPIPYIKKWLGEAKSKGRYLTQPVSPASDSDTLEHLEGKTYRIVLYREQVDIHDFCDIHMDSTFGGDASFQGFNDFTVTLYFRTDDLNLSGILLSAHSAQSGYIHISITLRATAEGKIKGLDGLTMVEGVLSEEWAMLGTDEVDMSEIEKIVGEIPMDDFPGLDGLMPTIPTTSPASEST